MLTFKDDGAPTLVHSHNDYQQEHPLLDALSWKCGSVEADVWLKDGELYVAHIEEKIDKKKTLSSLYIEPLKQILMENIDNNGKSSIYKDYPDVSLQLLIEMKYPKALKDGKEIEKIGIATIEAVETALEPLKNWLTNYTGSMGVSKGAVTIVLTGNSPGHYISAKSSRSYFHDAPLDGLTSAHKTDISPIASANWLDTVKWEGYLNPSKSKIEKICEMISAAHEKGITARFFGTPTILSLEERIWKIILEQGGDWLNSNDLPKATKFYRNFPKGKDNPECQQ